MSGMRNVRVRVSSWGRVWVRMKFCVGLELGLGFRVTGRD